MANTISNDDVQRVVRDLNPDTLTIENMQALQNKYAHPAVTGSEPGDMIWGVPRAITGEESLVVVRFDPRGPTRGVLSRNGENDYEGQVTVEGNALLLHAEKPRGEIYNLRTGKRVTP
jgi:hypothetical protein